MENKKVKKTNMENKIKEIVDFVRGMRQEAQFDEERIAEMLETEEGKIEGSDEDMVKYYLAKGAKDMAVSIDNCIYLILETK